jgi:carbon-monoxide dehydrogenase medium subunit
MQPFSFYQPDTLQEVFSLNQQYGDDDVHLIAGGTSLVLLMNLGLVQPKHIVSINRLTGLQGIAVSDGWLTIGALTTHRQAEKSPDVQAFCPALRDTFEHVATVRIRNQATIGGNLAHADPAQDPPPMLIVLDAQIVLQGPNGERSLPLDQFFVDYLTTVLHPGEVVTAVKIPPLADGTRAHYEKFLPRTQDDYATVSVAATLRTDGDNRCQDVRLALGGVAGTPVHARPVEDALRGEELSDQRIKEAAALVLDVIDPPADARGSADYKRRMARVWTERTLLRLRDGAAPGARA